MKETKELRDAVREGLAIVAKKPDVKEAEVFAASNLLHTLRVCYATNVPSNALEEPKSRESFGLSVRVLFRNGMIGFGKADADISGDAAEKAYSKALCNRVHDNDFRCLAHPAGKPKIRNYHDRAIENLDDERAISLAYEGISGAFDSIGKRKEKGEFNLTGELDFLSERIAIANTNGIDDYDESTVALCTLTTIFEMEKDFAGMWFDSATSLRALKPYEAGKTSVEKAHALLNSATVDSGKYDVVMGRIAIADLLYSRFSVGLSAIDMNASPYIGKLDSRIAVEQLNIRDDGLYEDAIGTKAITDEGIPTGRTEIIKGGRLVNLLSDNYYARKYGDDKRYNMRNGFRFGGGGRNHDSAPGISATNLVVESGDFSEEELVREVRNGLYIGRIWYSYPVNGLTSADFTSTVRGDSYIIKDGEIVSGLVPNTCRINDNLERVFMNIAGISRKKLATLAWGEENVVITPEVAVKGMAIERIAKGLY